MNNVGKKELKQERIKIERYYDDNLNSYCADVNGLLKGEWDDYTEYRGPNNEVLYEINYNRVFKRSGIGEYDVHLSYKIPINEYGYFYNKFSCIKYDRILNLPVIDIYICEINGKFGLIDADENTILHTAYKDIHPFFVGVFPESGLQYVYFSEEKFYYSSWKYKNEDNVFFIVTTESGKFLYNLSKKISSTIYDDIFIYTENHPQIIYKRGEKYGVLGIDGNVLFKPLFDFHIIFPRGLYFKFQDSVFKVWEEDGLFYGIIPSAEYDVCFKVGDHFVTKRGSKYGLITSKLSHVSEPVLDDIMLYQENKISKGCLRNRYYSENDKKWIESSFIIAKEGTTFKLFNLNSGHLIVDNCKSIIYKHSGKSVKYVVVEFLKGNIQGYVLWNEIIISTAEYEDIDTADDYISVKRNGKYGLYSPSGDKLYPCIYDSIQMSWGGELILSKDGEEEKLNHYSKQHSYNHGSYEKPSYGRYAGSYAQDEAGYSDDEIDTIFDGDPDAYWNID